MRFGKIFFILIISTLFITTINVDAQTNSDSSNKSVLFITTDKSSYKENDTIIVSGNVTAIILDTPVALQVFHEGTWKVAAQIIVAQDGTFTHPIPTGGPQWQKDGTYTVRASYGAGHIAETNFDYKITKEIPETKDNFEVDAGSYGTFDVAYTIRGAEIKEMQVDPNIFGIKIKIEPKTDGDVTLNLPRNAVDAKNMDETDTDFIILIDGVQTSYDEVINKESRIITIDFEKSDSSIEIIGTFVIPEFRDIVSVILFVSILGGIIISMKKPLSFKTKIKLIQN